MARIGFSTSRHLPTVRTQPRAEYLHAIGPAAVVSSLQETLAPRLGQLRFGVSRVDRSSDWQGWSLTLDDAHRFVCRADARRTYELGGILTGFEFGTRKTKTLSARLYDKTPDIAAKGNEWWFEVWGDRYRPGTPVHRLVFEVGRQGLVEFDLDTPAQVLAAAGDLWTYATGQWLTHRSPTDDHTRSRWPLSPQWREVQHATLSHRPIGIERLRFVHRTTSIARLLPGLTRYLASFGALIGTGGIEDTVGAVGHHLHNYEVISRTSFADRMERRRSEQAAEGFSIAGQADKLRVYAELHDLGEVTVVSDPGLFGKNLERPGLQQVLHMVNEDHVTNVLTWRLDRLSRNLSDLILLADQFGQCGVALHSFTEKIDLSSATGRMFYNILGSSAQFYREQLAENVRMGMHQAVRQGKWINRPKTGYDLIGGELVPNKMAPVVRRIFAMRDDGACQTQIAEATGVKYSTVLSILHSRIYLGEVLLAGEWFPGHDEPLITPEVFAAAHRGRTKGRNMGSDLLCGRVRCGLCGRLMAIDQNGEGRKMYRCRHRGQGCTQPRRTNEGLLRAAVLGLRLIGHDEQLKDAIRHELERARQPAPKAGGGPARRSVSEMDKLERQRRKLLRVYYDDRLGADLFAEGEARIALALAAGHGESAAARRELEKADDVSRLFEEVAQVLADLDIDRAWAAATESERWILIEELVENVTVLPDHLEVTVSGAPRLHVRYQEVGLKESGLDRVRGAYDPLSTPALLRGRVTLKAA